MTATLTIQDLFTFILYILGVGVLVYLIVLIKNLNKLVSNVKDLLKSNEKEIETTLNQLPGISKNLNCISEDTKELLESVSPEAKNIIYNTSSISKKVDNTSDKICNTIGIVSESVSSTASTIEYNVKNVNDYIELFVEIVEIIKNVITKHKS